MINMTDMNIMNIKRFIKDIMVLLDETRLHNTLRISHRGFNQLFSSSNYIHGICDTNNNILYIDIISTDKLIDSEIYVKLICGYFAPSNVFIKQIPRLITDN